MPANPKNIVSGEKLGFTLIELIIVVVIIAILAMVAIPRYFANVNKAQKTQVYANLKTILSVCQAYYAVSGTWPPSGNPGVFPIIVTVDGDTVVSIGDPSNSQWSYVTLCGTSNNFVAAVYAPYNCWLVAPCSGASFYADGHPCDQW